MITGRYVRWLKPKHKFVWGLKGWVRVNRYGEYVSEPEIIGATEKEAEEILAEAIEGWLSFNFSVRPIQPYTWPSCVFKFLGW
jgi:hypothetical protein